MRKWLLLIAATGCGPGTPPQHAFAIDPIAVAPDAAPSACSEPLNIDGVAFELRLAGGKTQFKPGQRIPIELLFSSTKADTYKVDGALYDRVGRLHSDDYHINRPDAAVDPLSVVFDSGMTGMGGLRNVPVLTVEPHIVPRTLNEYLRFDQPGEYRMCVTAHRIQSADDYDLPVRSNTIVFTIEPNDPAWETRALADAIADLDGGDSEKAAVAAETLRFLATPGAVREMARRFDGRTPHIEGNFEFGLIGSRHRDLVIAELQRLLVEPSHPVTFRFLQTLAMLDRAAAFPLLGPYPLDAAAQTEWQDGNAKRRDHETAARKRYAGIVASILATKHANALATSVATLLEIAWMSPDDPPDWADALRDQLVVSFHDLTIDIQSRLLRDRWRRIAGPDMAAIAEGILAEKSDERSSLRDIALQRLYELDPITGRREILDEIEKPTGRYGVNGMDVLGRLPDAQLPALDEVMAANLEREAQNPGPLLALTASIVERYGSKRFAARVDAVLAGIGGTYLSPERMALTAYLLRAAPKLGAAAMNDAFSASNRIGNAYQLPRLAALHAGPQFEAVAIALLDAEPSVAVQAAVALSQHGSAAAEAPLWKLAERFHATWKDRADELKLTGTAPNPNAEFAALEQQLWSAIAHGAAWVVLPDELAKLVELCVTEQEKQQASYLAEQWTSPIRIYVAFHDSGEIRAQVAHYDRDLDSLAALEAKLAQFPAGSVFRFEQWGATDAELQSVRTALTAQLSANGMSLK